MSTLLPSTRLLPQLSTRASATQSSAIRDLLSQAKQPGMISLAGGLPDASMFPRGELAELAASIISMQGRNALQYGLTAGDEQSRRAAAALFGPDAEPDELVITTGSQQGLDLLARALIDPGDQVVVGDPDYLGALQVFRSYGAALCPIAVDAYGLVVEQLEDQLRDGLRPKCCYIVPHFHNPTGATLAPQRRARLDELASRYGFVVIEDDPYRDLFYGGMPPMNHEVDLEHTAQLRSASKILAPGLRIGVLRAPSWLRDPVITAKQSTDLHASSLSQALVTAALGSPWIIGHLDTLRATYGLKRNVLVDALTSTFGDAVEFVTPQGGMFVWARFLACDDTTEWLGRCQERGVCFVPGTAFAVDRDLSQFARLSFSTGSVAAIEEGVQRMANC